MPRAFLTDPGLAALLSHNLNIGNLLSRYVWSLRHGTLVRALRGHSDVVSAVAWSPTVPGVLATASDDFTVKVWGRPCTRLRLDCGGDEDRGGGGDGGSGDGGSRGSY